MQFIPINRHILGWTSGSAIQFVLAKNFGETSKDLLESLGNIKEHQALFNNTLASFKEVTGTSISRIEGVVASSEELITTSMSKISEYQSAVESFRELIAESMAQVSGYQEALQERFRKCCAEN